MSIKKDTAPEVPGKKRGAAPETDPEIDRVAAALAIPEDDAPVLVEPDPEPAAEEAPAPVPTRKKTKATHTHKVTEWCGELHHDGKKYLAGEGINLSDEEAAGLSKNVEPWKA